MLPLQQAYEVKEAISEYLKATFTFREEKLNEAFEQFLNNKNNGIFKGPYLSMKLPFVKADEGTIIPLDIKPNFTPYKHQLTAFERLSSLNGNEPKPTLLTTGTGSGKTESFLFPVLDYCYHNLNRSGVKVIILYPMNALATDQARRIAKTIFADERIKGKITAGLFIGEGKKDDKKSKIKYSAEMGPENIIEDKNRILESPPDILLTNFKMLDYALMRNNYHKIWRENLKDNTLLRFLILDELHTYDGAQGSDVANLIRRLKLKLQVPDKLLCPIGTSATMGSGTESKQLLIEYASKIFEEEIPIDAVIEETRLTLDQFFENTETKSVFPSITDIKDAVFLPGDSLEEYHKRQLQLWGIEIETPDQELGHKLKEFSIFKEIISITAKGVVDIKELIAQLNLKYKEFDALPNVDKTNGTFPKYEILNSIFSLISHAKTKESSMLLPFLFVQVQLWIRALHGVSKLVQETEKFVWNNDPVDNEIAYLPPYFCRECGGSGWIGVKKESSDSLETDVSEIYDKYFSRNKNIYFISRYGYDVLAKDYAPTDVCDEYIDPQNLNLFSNNKDGLLHILRVRKTKDTHFEEVCPHCNSNNTLAMIGTGVATMASIATGQTLATNLDDAKEQERKVLIFTNGVQDAAHQAGFIEARNFRFAFRTALQCIVNECKNEVSLPELYSKFVEYWSAHCDPNNLQPKEAFIRKFFPTDYIGQLKVETYKTGEEKFRDNFFEEFKKRMHWEIWSEYGYNATIGRTLEKTGVSTAYIRPDKLRGLYKTIQTWLSDKNLNAIDEEGFVKFLTGILYRIRIRGGVDHEFLMKFRKEKSSYFLITKTMNPQHHFIKNFGKYTRLPRLLSDDLRFSKVFDVVIRKDNGNMNWFHQYLIKSFPFIRPEESTLINDFYSILLEYLDAENILDKKLSSGTKNYAINPHEIFVSKEVAQYKCNTCGNIISGNSVHKEVYEGMSCLQFNCSGTYKYYANTEYDYYKTVYNRAHAIRIFAADHTGLLDRDVREEIESDFKKRPKFNSKNLLVATSTLEMGIDVGDLNSTFNTSIPPLPSNYLQRIGRAGRSSGNALVLNFVGKDNHDHYYYNQPREMMEGKISTPGCFLEAKEILRRHLIAYCIDTWTSNNYLENYIPKLVFELKINKINADDKDFFINKLVGFIRENEKNIINRFKEKYRQFIIDYSSVESLEIEFLSGRIYTLLHGVFPKLKAELEFLQNRKKEIIAQIKKLPASDPELKELESIRNGVSKSMRAFYQRNFIEYLTNIGLLPNYAFPETGVLLEAQIRERTGEQNASTFSNKSFEVVRPAKTALRELAPDNVFYSQGYKLNISGVKILNRKDDIIEYKFCSKCDYIEKIEKTKDEVCPKCGDISWRAASNKHWFLKMSSMTSRVDSSEAAILDSNEEREFKNYSISRHFKFDETSSGGAHVLKQIPFGMEYFKSISLMEINTGLVDGFFDRSRQIKINDSEHSDLGYIVCKSCGKVTKRKIHEPKKYDYHYLYCKNRAVQYTDVADETFDELYLFRELKSEGLKILIPVQELDSEIKIKLFKAGLALGLKNYYKGNPQHIDIHEYTGYNKQTGKKDRYIVLMESIPGGTGYLSRLFDEIQFSEVLKLAYESIRDCQCKQEGKNGCYHCIYTYSNQYDRSLLKRDEAEELFQKIVEKTNEWIYLEDGLDGVTNSGNIEESELEERFISILRNYFENPVRLSEGCYLKPIKIDGIINYELKIVNGVKEFFYQIEPQFKLDKRHGIEYNTVADFMITCTGYHENGQSRSDLVETFRPVAIYLDGHAFHATERNNRFLSDVLKRKSINDTEYYLTWTLTWEDLSAFENKNADTLCSLINPEVLKTLRKINHPLVPTALSFYNTKNGLERLLVFLENNNEAHIYGNAKLTFFSMQHELLGKCIKQEQIEIWQKYSDKTIQSFLFEKQNPQLHTYIDKLPLIEHIDYRVFQHPESFVLSGNIHLKDVGLDWEKNQWNLFWNVFNLLQFTEGIQIKIVTGKNDKVEEEKSDIDDVLENFDTKYHNLVRLLFQHRIQFNETETFVIEENGEFIAEADLGLPQQKIVFGVLGGDESLFINRGYRVERIENFDIKQIL